MITLLDNMFKQSKRKGLLYVPKTELFNIKNKQQASPDEKKLCKRSVTHYFPYKVTT